MGSHQEFVNTVGAHLNRERSEYRFCFDAHIVQKIIGVMLFDLDDDGGCMSKEIASPMFNKSEEYIWIDVAKSESGMVISAFDMESFKEWKNLG